MRTVLKLPGIQSAPDLAQIEKALEAVPRVQSVTIDRGAETATVEHDGADRETLRAAARTLNLAPEFLEPMEASRGATKVILAPVDFSKVTDRVVDEAATLARILHGRVVLVHVTEPTTGVVDFAAIVVAVAQVNEAAVKQAAERLRQIGQRLEQQGVEASSVQATGTPVSEILQQAARLSADYIVIGSHGHTALYDLLVGGTAHGVLKRATCPVVIVPPPPEAER